MGGCFSSIFSDSDFSSPTAKVVSLNGDLYEYPLPIAVSQVLQAQRADSSSSSSSRFLCNSDMLSYDEFIPVMDSEAQLQANQIYFLLHKSRLQRRLTASDMAALAVKASEALQNGSKKNPNRRKPARISPILLVNQTTDENEAVKSFEKPKQQEQQPPLVFSRPASVRKLHRYTSRRAKLAVRSFKLRLSTIYEGTVL